MVSVCGTLNDTARLDIDSTKKAHTQRQWARSTPSMNYFADEMYELDQTAHMEERQRLGWWLHAAR
jgi:hypothetical protein